MSTPSSTPAAAPGPTGSSDAAATPALPVTFRPTRTRVVLLTVGVLMFGVISFAGLTLNRLNPGERISFVFTACIFLGVLCLLARPKVVADAAGVTVVNITRVRRLEWAEILRVNLRTGDPWVFLDLSDGSSHPVLGIQPGIAREQAISDARALRALAESRGGVEP
ncbi:PH domain-containing protein [Streptomyces sp. NPDC000594]|uniref:PH domain-containing protein n=1 Tax=Streptomyces sp. NPDC000594 TaxID=3154261 RepID=UPI00331DA17C